MFSHRPQGEGVIRNIGGRGTKKVLKRTPQLPLLGKVVSVTQTAALDMTEAGREGAREQKNPDFQQLWMFLQTLTCDIGSREGCKPYLLRYLYNLFKCQSPLCVLVINWS